MPQVEKRTRSLHRLGPIDTPMRAAEEMQQEQGPHALRASASSGEGRAHESVAELRRRSPGRLAALVVRLAMAGLRASHGETGARPQQKLFVWGGEMRGRRLKLGGGPRTGAGAASVGGDER